MDTSVEQTRLEKDIGMFVQENKDYYDEEWQKLANGKLSFNVIAFFFPIFWLGYRKMYRHIGVIVMIFLIYTIPAIIITYVV